MLRLISAIIATAAVFLQTTQVQAARVEKAIGAGLAFYSGSEGSALTPGLAPNLSFSANVLYRKLNLVNRFELGILTDGKNFAGQYGTYSGYSGSYTFNFKFNFSKEHLQPYLEFGPTLGLYAATLSSADSSISKNQTSLKYGFAIGTGFDWLKSGTRGEGKGWGLGFSYFQYMKSPSIFEFPAAALNARGVKLELRYIFGENR